jgi:glycosyltransferase 2 family protein
MKHLDRIRKHIVLVRIAILALVTAVLWTEFHRYGLSTTRIWGDIGRIGRRAALVGIVGGFGVAGSQSMRWWFVTSPVLRIRYRDALAAILVGNFFNIVLPARAGDALRVDDLSRRAGVSRATLFGTELVDFVADKSGWLPAFALLLLTGVPPSWMIHALLLAIGLIVVIAGMGVALRDRFRAAAHQRDGWIGRLAIGITANHPRRLATAAFVVAAAPWLFEAPILREVAASSGVQLSFLQAFAVLTAFNVANIVPTPGGVGPNEAASTAALVSFGVPSDRAIAFAFVYHATQLVPGLVAGGLLLLLRRMLTARRREGSLQTPQLV